MIDNIKYKMEIKQMSMHEADCNCCGDHRGETLLKEGVNQKTCVEDHVGTTLMIFCLYSDIMS